MRVKVRAAFAATVLAWASGAAADAPPSSADFARRFGPVLASLHPEHGDVTLPSVNGTLHLSDGYYFLEAEDARRVLTTVWGNPPESVSHVLGLVMPAGKRVIDDSWGAVVTYDPSGYVSDSDAKSARYDDILDSFRKNEDDLNAERKKNGFDPEHLVGWAQPPSYDPAHHSMVWARDVRFGAQTDDTLNYDIRLLGRRGVLSLNMVSSMSDLPDVRAQAANLAALASFDPGARYADYKPGADKAAGYGLAGLVAAGVGVVAAKKLGLIAILALAGKKLFIVIAALFAGLWKRIRSMFGARTAE